MKKSDQMQKLAAEMSDQIVANNSEGAVIALSSTDDRTAVAVVGTPSELVILLAKAINGKPELKSILESALLAAPVVDILYGKGQDVETCDCPNCTADRAAKAKDINVN